jgi:hypothetical protein
MHLRRTDFTQAHKATYAETEEVTATLVRLAEENGVAHGEHKKCKAALDDLWRLEHLSLEYQYQVC